MEDLLEGCKDSRDDIETDQYKPFEYDWRKYHNGEHYWNDLGVKEPFWSGVAEAGHIPPSHKFLLFFYTQNSYDQFYNKLLNKSNIPSSWLICKGWTATEDDYINRNLV